MNFWRSLEADIRRASPAFGPCRRNWKPRGIHWTSISGKIIKEMPGSVASETPCIIETNKGNKVCILLVFLTYIKNNHVKSTTPEFPGCLMMLSMVKLHSHQRKNQGERLWKCGPGSVVGIATAYGLNGPGIESRWGREIFRTCPDRPWGPASFLYNGYRVFPGGKVRPGRDANPSPLLVPRSKIE